MGVVITSATGASCERPLAFLPPLPDDLADERAPPPRAPAVREAETTSRPTPTGDPPGATEAEADDDGDEAEEADEAEEPEEAGGRGRAREPSSAEGALGEGLAAWSSGLSRFVLMRLEWPAPAPAPSQASQAASPEGLGWAWPEGPRRPGVACLGEDAGSPLAHARIVALKRTNLGRCSTPET